VVLPVLEILENFKKYNMEVKDGYVNVVNTADDVWSRTLQTVNDDGEVLLAYKNTDADISLGSSTEVLYQVIVKRLYNNPSKRKYTVNITTSSVSYVLNMVPKEYLLGELITELERFKVSGNIIANFKQIIEDIEE
jgi:hypothetical protein